MEFKRIIVEQRRKKKAKHLNTGKRVSDRVTLVIDGALAAFPVCDAVEGKPPRVTQPPLQSFRKLSFS